MKIPALPKMNFNLSVPKMRSKSEAVQVIVEVGDDYVQWVCGVHQRGRFLVHKICSQKFEKGNDNAISDYIAKCYDDSKIRVRHAIAIVPPHLSIAKNIDMPSNDPAEIQKIVNLHAGRYTPYSREEIIIDYLSMAVEGQHYTNVLLMIIHRSVAERLIQIMNMAGVYLENIITPQECMAHIFNQWAQPEMMSDPVWGIHLHDSGSDLIFSDRRQMVYVRNIPVGARQLSEGGGDVSSFVQELKQSISAYQEQGVGRPIRHVLMTGIPSAVEQVKDAVKELLNAMGDPAIQFYDMDYCERFSLSDAAAETLKINPKISAFQSIAALEGSPLAKIKLLPDDVKLRRKMKEGGKEIISLGIVVMTCLLLISIFLATKIYLKGMRIEMIDNIYEKTTEEARQLENASTKSRVLRELLEKRGKGLFVFEKFGSMLGDDIYLSGFSYNQEGELIIKGTADSMSRVFAFVNDLEESVFFRDVEAQETKTRKEKGTEVADFQIACLFTEPEE